MPTIAGNTEKRFRFDSTACLSVGQTHSSNTNTKQCCGQTFVHTYYSDDLFSINCHIDAYDVDAYDVHAYPHYFAFSHIFRIFFAFLHTNSSFAYLVFLYTMQYPKVHTFPDPLNDITMSQSLIVNSEVLSIHKVLYLRNRGEITTWTILCLCFSVLDIILFLIWNRGMLMLISILTKQTE